MSKQSKLAWRCRRGMKELDLVMEGYLRRHYAYAAVEEQLAFEALLDQQDPLLYAYVTGRAEPEDPGQQRVVAKLRRVMQS